MKIRGRIPKHNPTERLITCILYLRKVIKSFLLNYHSRDRPAKSQGIRDESFRWNYSRTSVCDDCIFICDLICTYMANEVSWPDQNRRRELALREPMFYGCIGYIDGTLIRIQKPQLEGRFAERYFNGRKKIYAMNNTIVVDHDGLITYIDPGYPGSYHDVSILRESGLYKDWRHYFTREHQEVGNDYDECLLGDRKL